MDKGRYSKWAISGLILILVSVIVVACSSTNEQVDSVNQDNAVNEGEDLTSFPLSEPVEVNILAQRNPLVQKDYSEMTGFLEMEKRSNVIVNWDLVMTQNWDEQFNLMLASGDLPDAFFGRGSLTQSQLVEMSGQGLLLPLDDLIEEHAPNIKVFFEEFPEARANFLSPDGKLYTIPTVLYFDHHRVGTRMFINEKWLEQIDRDIPQTTEEFYEVLKVFSEQDMNGNGINDEIPFSFEYPDGQRGPWGISSAFGISDSGNHQYVKDDEIHFAPMKEEYREYVKYMHRLKSEGLIDQEVFTHNEQAYIAKIRENPSSVGAFVGWVWTTYFDSKEASDYVALPALEGPDGHRGWPHYPMSSNAGGLTITHKNPHPVETIKWFDMIYGDEELLISLDYGPRGVNWDYSETGGLQFIDPPEGMGFEEFRHSDSPGNRSASSFTPELYQKLAEGERGIQESLELVEVYQPHLDETFVPNLTKTFEDNERYNQIFTDVSEYVQTQYAQWVFDGGIDEGWDAYLEQLQRLGVEEMMEIQNRYYQKMLDEL